VPGPKSLDSCGAPGLRWGRRPHGVASYPRRTTCAGHLEQELHIQELMRPVAGLALVVMAAFGCSCGESKSAGKASDTVQPTASKAAVDKSEQADPAPSGPGTQTHQNGIERFKDPGVYADGMLVGMLMWSELPMDLPVLWHEERAALEFKASDPGPREKIVKQRRYSFQDYFAAIGLDVERNWRRAA